MTSAWQRILSTLVCAYIRNCPVDKGKWLLLRWVSPSLVVELEPGLYLRASEPADEPVEKGLVWRGLLEQEEVRLFLGLIRPGMTVVDVGANVGMYTVLAARHVGPQGRVIAFEPTPRVARKLRGNVELNHLQNVQVIEAALSDTAGKVTFFLQEESDRNSLAARAGTPIDVEAKTLDQALAEQGIERVDVLKIDVEGAEVRALTGGARLLAGPEAPLLLVEFNDAALHEAGGSAAQLRALLEGYGYRCHLLGAPGDGSYFNALASKPGHHERFPGLTRAGLTALP